MLYVVVDVLAVVSKSRKENSASIQKVLIPF